VFSPRTRLHAANVFDSFRKGIRDDLQGSVLTSWSVHLFPWELQTASIAIPQFVHTRTDESLEQFGDRFAEERFGRDGNDFWRACDLLSGHCLFTYTASLGFGKSCDRVPAGHVGDVLARTRDEGGIDEQRSLCERRLGEYAEALNRLSSMQSAARRGHDLLNVWKLAARNLMNRAEVSQFLLEHADAVIEGRGLQSAAAQRARILLGRMRALRAETDSLYEPMVRPARRSLMMHFLFDAIDTALSALSGS
jgi:hypothetical protein